VDELEKVLAQIADLQTKARELQQKKKSAVIEEIKLKIKQYGLTARDLGLGSSSARDVERRSVAIKYRSGDYTWTGRGRKPKWVEKHLSSGGSLESLAV
jgi:DNA-binding protein H-NS